jgi:hypothetical protein
MKTTFWSEFFGVNKNMLNFCRHNLKNVSLKSSPQAIKATHDTHILAGTTEHAAPLLSTTFRFVSCLLLSKFTLISAQEHTGTPN